MLLESTQGHVSKLLRGRFKRASRVTRALEDYAAGLDLSVARQPRTALTPTEARVLRAVRDVAHGDEAKLNLLSEVLALVGRLQERR